MTSSQARYDMLTETSGRRVMVVEGDWTVFTIGPLDKSLRALSSDEAPDAIDVAGLEAFDTAGAYLIDRVLRMHSELVDTPAVLLGDHPNAAHLLETARAAVIRKAEDEPEHASWRAVLERTGRGTMDMVNEALGMLAFVGEAVSTIFRLLLRPQRIRWTSVVSVAEDAGLDALPIVSMLSFFIGLVIAFLGVNLLQQFGAQVFTVEMVGVLMLRELGVVLTAILLAGRTNSAFTAQIGSMKMREEVDAMRVLGLDPMEVLVAPRLLALIVMTPFLTFAAMLSGILGGMIVMWTTLDISPALFIQRIYDTVPGQHFWAGIIKAPFFAMVVGLVGCRQGLLVEGDVQTLGHRTTTSVVQAIFLVIVIDALFALLYLELDI
ncbi:MAG: ABC transporter permease [Hirschia sp.]|nr:ABC transporter permease [Hirschia sp.]MBF17454.1 ABC transporter permease [Hirschia sp.]